MVLPIMHGTGRLTAAPDLRFSKNGTAVCSIPLAFNSRTYNRETGQWEDGDVLFIRGTLFGEHAEHATESYGRGDEVVVSGRVKTDQWSDKQTGENRSATSLLLDSIGASTRNATTTITKAERRQPASSEPAAMPSGGSVNEPPF